jgi:glyoxylase-like metal-dependent hydrolase (beta-lactamase superfamily II)
VSLSSAKDADPSPSVLLRRLILSLALVAGCTRDLELAPAPPTAAAITTAGPWASMIFVARTDSGVIAIDLGWTGTTDALTEVLARIGATPADVRWVFLTHAHRDHIGGWPDVKQATFVLGLAETPYLVGAAEYTGVVTELADRMNAYPRPRASEVTLLPVSGDTAFVFGADTLRAYATPGHTPGSTVYLFRETLFVGDAANWRPWSGFAGARWEYSEDVEQSRRSMASLVHRLDSARVVWRTLCTAHAKCGAADSTLRREILR